MGSETSRTSAGHGTLVSLRDEARELLHVQDSYDLALWAFTHWASTGVLRHADLVHDDAALADNPIIRSTLIPGGAGTIGYVLVEGKPTCVNDTFDDPRGTVSTQDYVLGDASWCGVPVKNESEDVVSILSFFPIQRKAGGGPAVDSDRGAAERYAQWTDAASACSGMDEQATMAFVRDELTGLVERHKDTLLVWTQLAKSQGIHELVMGTLLDRGRVPLEDGTQHAASGTSGLIPDILRRFQSVVRVVQPHECVIWGREEPAKSTSLVVEAVAADVSTAETEAAVVKQFSELTGVDVHKLYEKCSLVTRTLFGKSYTVDERWSDDGKAGIIWVLRRVDSQAPDHTFAIIDEPFLADLDSLLRGDGESKDASAVRRRKIRLDIANQYFRLLCDYTFGMNFEGREGRLAELARVLSQKSIGLQSNALSRLKEIRGLPRSPASEGILGLMLFARQSVRTIRVDRTPPTGPTWARDMRDCLSGLRVIQRECEHGSSEPPGSVLRRYPISRQCETLLGVEQDPGHQAGENGGRTSVDCSRFSNMPVKDVDDLVALCLSTSSCNALLRSLFGTDACLKRGASGDSQPYALQCGVPEWDQLEFHEVDLQDVAPGRHVLVGRRASQTEPEGFKEAEGLLRNSMAAAELMDQAVRVRASATRAAVAAIMARNMSHNIGSHVLGRLSHEDELVEKDLPKEDYATRAVAASAAMLNQYLRTRMDFVADIATGEEPPMPMSLRLLDDIMKPVAGIAQLWSNIGRSNGLGQDTIRFRVGVRGPSDEFPGIVPLLHTNGYGFEQKDFGGWLRRLSSVALAVPAGTMGVQAFYAILEGFVRNTVKNSATRKDTLVVTLVFDFTYANPSLMRVEMYNDWGECAINPKLPGILNDKIRESVLKPDGGVQKTNRGFKEMKASAAYLRGLAPTCVDDETLSPQLLEAHDFAGNLGLVFHAQRPRTLLVLDSELRALDRTRRDALLAGGVGIVTTSSDAESTSAGFEVQVTAEDPVGTLAQGLNDRQPLRQLAFTGSGVTASLGKWRCDLALSDIETCKQEFRQALRDGKCEESAFQAWRLWTRAIAGEPMPELVVKPLESQTWDGRIGDESGEPSRPGDRQIVYARHGYSLANEEREVTPDKVIFYEPCNKGDILATLLESPPVDKTARQILNCQLYEAALVRVLVVDERVQAAARSARATYSQDRIRTSNGEGSLEYWLAQAGVCMPPDSLEKLEGGQPGLEKLTTWLDTRSEPTGGGRAPTILVVHEGILEHVGLRARESATAWFTRIKSKCGISEVVVTSGRGLPQEVPDGVRFLALSQLLRHTIEARSKLNLVHALASAGVVRRR